MQRNALQFYPKAIIYSVKSKKCIQNVFKQTNKRYNLNQLFSNGTKNEATKYINSFLKRVFFFCEMKEEKKVFHSTKSINSCKSLRFWWNVKIRLSIFRCHFFLFDAIFPSECFKVWIQNSNQTKTF